MANHLLRACAAIGVLLVGAASCGQSPETEDLVDDEMNYELLGEDLGTEFDHSQYEEDAEDMADRYNSSGPFDWIDQYDQYRLDQYYQHLAEEFAQDRYDQYPELAPGYGDESTPMPGDSPLGAANSCPAGCSTPPPGCVIKGNISIDTGEHIYHVPGQEFYDETVISPEYGERWFCTEDEARASGWRRSYH